MNELRDLTEVSTPTVRYGKLVKKKGPIGISFTKKKRPTTYVFLNNLY